MSREEAISFVTRGWFDLYSYSSSSSSPPSFPPMNTLSISMMQMFTFFTYFTAVSLAMSRDGSSGGIVRLCVVDANGAERHTITGNKLPYPISHGK
jgi:hypothetical protein